MREYEVLKDHNGEIPYTVGQTRRCDEYLGRILVNAGILREKRQTKAHKSAPRNKDADA